MSKRLRSSEVCADCSAQGRHRRRPGGARRAHPPPRRTGAEGRRGGSAGPALAGGSCQRGGPGSGPGAPRPCAGGVTALQRPRRQRGAGFGRVFNGPVRIGPLRRDPLSHRAPGRSARPAVCRGVTLRAGSGFGAAAGRAGRGEVPLGLAARRVPLAGAPRPGQSAAAAPRAALGAGQRAASARCGDALVCLTSMEVWELVETNLGFRKWLHLLF